MTEAQIFLKNIKMNKNTIPKEKRPSGSYRDSRSNWCRLGDFRKVLKSSQALGQSTRVRIRKKNEKERQTERDEHVEIATWLPSKQKNRRWKRVEETGVIRARHAGADWPTSHSLVRLSVWDWVLRKKREKTEITAKTSARAIKKLRRGKKMTTVAGYLLLVVEVVFFSSSLSLSLTDWSKNPVPQQTC